MKLRSAALTDVGRTRAHNEDSLAIAADQRLFIVADGMGGHELGEVASRMAVDAVVTFFQHTPTPAAWPAMDPALPIAVRRLLAAIQLANRRIFDMACRERKTTGTTIVAAHLADSLMYIAHVGDSRAYLIRDGHIVQLTRDHSALEEYKRASPDLTEQEIRDFPYRNVIMRALGSLPEVQIDSRAVLVEPGDVFLLCCDGLSNMVDDASMLRIVEQTRDLDHAVRALVAAANEAGGEDNISVVLVRCESR